MHSMSNSIKLTRHVSLGKLIASRPYLIVIGIIDLTHWTEEQIKDLDELIEKNETPMKERKAEVLPTMNMVSEKSVSSLHIVLRSIYRVCC